MTSKSTTDCVFRLRRILTDIQDSEYVESIIAKEIQDIENAFKEDEGAFYREMKDDSIQRARKLINMRNRTQGIVDRLSAFLKRDRDREDILFD